MNRRHFLRQISKEKSYVEQRRGNIIGRGQKGYAGIAWQPKNATQRRICLCDNAKREETRQTQQISR